MFSLRALWSGRHSDNERPSAYPAAYRFRPQLEGFEDRTVPHGGVDLGPALVGDISPAQIENLINITGVNLTDFQIVDGVLTAAGTVTGTLAGLPFTADITNFALQLVPDDPGTPAEECSVLHLELAPINLALLGLHVDTSAICLDITATEGGGLLGDLLCSLAGGGTGGLGVPTIPIGDQLSDLLGGLTDILNGILGGGSFQPGGSGEVCTGECEVLDLVLGPINLSLLGLNVSLDNCADGPVEVCVSATAGEGLLGDLLCGLTGFPNLDLSLQDITQIIDQASDALEDGVLSGRERGQLVSLINRLKN
jgi:hypothetical protein